MAKNGTTKIVLEREKETPGTVRYREQTEEGQPPILGTLYIKKWFAGSCETVEVTITKK